MHDGFVPFEAGPPKHPDTSQGNFGVSGSESLGFHPCVVLALNPKP